MNRITLAALSIAAFIVGTMTCSQDNGSNAGSSAVSVVGTWESSIQLSPDSTIAFSILLAADSTDTVNAEMTLTVPLLGRITVPAYREFGVWTVIGDSIQITRVRCETNIYPPPAPQVWTPGTCNSSTAKMPINIRDNAWTVKFASLKPYIPAGFSVPGYSDDADVVLVRQ